MVFGADQCKSVVVRAEGLTLREWEEGDISVIGEMFNTAEIDRWTPLAHPFSGEVAGDYVHRAHQVKSKGTLQLAITTDGTTPLGEVLLFPASGAQVCEFAYAVGAAYRGQSLACRAIRALLPVAKAGGYRTATLTVAQGNLASQRVARAAGFDPDGGPCNAGSARATSSTWLHGSALSKHICESGKASHGVKRSMRERPQAEG